MRIGLGLPPTDITLKCISRSRARPRTAASRVCGSARPGARRRVRWSPPFWPPHSAFPCRYGYHLALPPPANTHRHAGRQHGPGRTGPGAVGYRGEHAQYQHLSRHCLGPARGPHARVCRIFVRRVLAGERVTRANGFYRPRGFRLSLRLSGAMPIYLAAVNPAHAPASRRGRGWRAVSLAAGATDSPFAGRDSKRGGALPDAA